MIEEDFRFGDWRVSPSTHSLTNEGERLQIEPRLMQVLTTLCYHANSVVSTEELLQQCWGGTFFGDNPVHKTIAQLRKVLGDRATDACYIETIRKRGYRAIADVVLLGGGLHGQQETEWLGGSPFRGLQAFEAEHAKVFHGRAEASARLLACARAQVDAGCALVLILGPSGSGKSSLVQAGVLPNLMRQGGAAGIAIKASATLDPGAYMRGSLMQMLGETLLSWQVDGEAVLPARDASRLGEQLASGFDSVATEIQWFMTQRFGKDKAPPRLALFIDRFEAIYGLPGATEAAHHSFVAALDAIARSGHVLVLIACRNDFYPRIAQHPALMSVKAQGGHFDLPLPTQAEIAQMIRLPARAAQLSFATDVQSQTRLDDELCAAAMACSDALPLLQYTLQALYEARGANGELSFEAFRAMGGIEGAIGSRAEALLRDLGEAERASLPHLFSLLITLSGDGDVVTSRRALWSALRSEAERALVQTLVEARLLVSELVGGEPGFGVAHEALLRNWLRATTWIAQHRDMLRVRSRVADLAKRWHSEGQRTDLLLPTGRPLDEALALLDSDSVLLSDEESAYIRTSSQRARTRIWLRRTALASILALSLLLGVVGVLAIRADQIAQARRAEAEGLMSYMLGDFADKLRPLGRLELLDGISSKALQYLAVDQDEHPSGTELAQRARALAVIAEVRVARGDPQGATTALNNARSLLLQNQRANRNDPEILKNLGTNAYWLGKIHYDKNDWANAQQYFEQYRDYSQQRAKLEPNNEDAWIEESYAHNNLGSLWLKQGKISQAVQAFERSVALKNQALQRRPKDATLQADIADSLTWVASSQQQAGHLQRALQADQQAIDILGRLHQASPSDASWTHRLAYTNTLTAELHLALGDQVEALAKLRGAGSLIDEIVKLQPDNLQWQRDRQYAAIRLVSIDNTMTDQQKIKEISVIMDQLARLKAKNPTGSQLLQLQADAVIVMAQLMAKSHDNSKALALIQGVIAPLHAATTANPSSVRTKEILARAWMVESGIRSTMGDSHHTQSCDAIVKLLTPDIHKTSDFRLVAPWAGAQACLGNTKEAAEAHNRLNEMGFHS